MANLKRNMIELIKNPEEAAKGEEPEIEKVWTPSFIPFRVSYEATKLDMEFMNSEDKSELEMVDRLVDFVADEIYDGKITKDDIFNRMHAPGSDDGKSALRTLQDQIVFASRGVQTGETKNFLKQKGS